MPARLASPRVCGASPGPAGLHTPAPGGSPCSTVRGERESMEVEGENPMVARQTEKPNRLRTMEKSSAMSAENPIEDERGIGNTSSLETSASSVAGR